DRVELVAFVGAHGERSLRACLNLRARVTYEPRGETLAAAKGDAIFIVCVGELAAEGFGGRRPVEIDERRPERRHLVDHARAESPEQRLLREDHVAASRRSLASARDEKDAWRLAPARVRHGLQEVQAARAGEVLRASQRRFVERAIGCGTSVE